MREGQTVDCSFQFGLNFRGRLTAWVAYEWDMTGYVMIAKDMIGNICGEYHGGILARSKDGGNWEASEGEKSYTRRIKWDDGTEQVMGSLERPFILFENNEPTHMFFATADGPGEFTKAANTWNMVIPLKRNES
ncbi:hypothetical protein A8709_20945 [Paenibacillus pectinilyticus]|uniref:Glycosyl hydrolase family 32 N-terminal domain-containing protein n=1 Tax=Paenibacillus pectinilyticus TaxID=512399 RepID=A0A1C0ZXK7_9BACL|nr:hypothetical protein [Paenibacillus pectinilyticus]OCT12809.1 hypothetical protein A8709_20945 [Paenibacillus pectinilyticus]